MFCPKCHTYIEDSQEYCPRCNLKVSKKRIRKYNSFSTSRTFSRMAALDYKKKNNKNEEKQEKEIENKINLNDHNETHSKQYEYSKNYSNVKEKVSDHQNQYEYSTNYSNINNETIMADEDYLKAYVGNSYYSIKSNSVSIPALFFGTIYLLYRKLKTLGIILIVIEMLTYEISEDAGIFMILVINIYLFKNFNNIYLKEVERRVNDIKFRNKDKTSQEIKEICKESGGVNL